MTTSSTTSIIRRQLWLWSGFHKDWRHRPLLGVFRSLSEANRVRNSMRIPFGDVSPKHYVKINGDWFRINATPEYNPDILEELNRAQVDDQAQRSKAHSGRTAKAKTSPDPVPERDALPAEDSPKQEDVPASSKTPST